MSIETLSDRLRRALEVAGLNMTDAAGKAGIPYRSIQNYVRGEREPGAEALAAITAQLRISADWLLIGEGQMFRGSDATTENLREQDLLALFRELPDDEQQELQRTALGKRRLREIERRLEEVMASLGELRSA